MLRNQQMFRGSGAGSGATFRAAAHPLRRRALRRRAPR